MEKNRNLVNQSRLFGVTAAIVGLTMLAIWLTLSSSAAARLDAGDGPGDSSAAAAGAQVVSMTVETPQTPVVPGDIVTYTIELTNPSSVTVSSVILSNTLPSGLKLSGSHGASVWLQEVTPTVAPLKAVLRWAPGDTPTALDWMGSLSDGAALRISYRAQVQACYDPGLFSIRNQVSVLAASSVHTDSVDIQVDCYPAVDPLNIDVSLNYVTGGYNPELNEIAQSIGPNIGYWQHPIFPHKGRVLMLITAVNSDANPAVLGLAGVFPSRDMMASPYLDSALAGYRVPHLGFKGVDGINLEMEVVAFRLRLEAGETRFIEIPYSPAIDLPSGTELVNRLGYCISQDGFTCPGATLESTEPPPSFQWVEPLTVTIRYRDLGDAPDRTNHTAAVTMTAYPGVQANFPTVFTSTTGSVQGPAHEYPRPFYLGHRVSPEVEADVGPDMDPTNNILPGLDAADLDQRDDGVRAPLTPIQQCQATILPVRVAIRPAAVTYLKSHGEKGYLNVWIDGNHDGDWQDSITCPTGQALEHVVIDREIDVVTLGAGLHTVMVPTGRVPWSAQDGQAAWVRVTLSELPANKTLNSGGVDHGDGRGYATPFALGETEDYLYRPDTDPLHGPDMEVEMVGIVRNFLKPDIDSDGAGFAEKVAFKIDYENEGDVVAEDVSLTQQLPSGFTGYGATELGSTSVPKIPADHITFDDDKITWQLGDVEPGEGGMVSVSWIVTGSAQLSALDTVSVGARYTSTAIITSSNDIDLSNNVVQAGVEQEPLRCSIGIHAAESGLPPYDELLVQNGTTCSNDIELRGRCLTDPGALLSAVTLAIVVDGTEVGTTTVAADGSWEFPITLADGTYQIRGITKRVDQVTPELVSRDAVWRNVGYDRDGKVVPAVVATVDSTLPWDPISLVFTNPEGDWIHPADIIGNGSLDASGWVVPLKPSTTYSVALRYCGDDPDPQISISVGGMVKDLDGYDFDPFEFETTFTTPGMGSSGRESSAPGATQYDAALYILSGQVESIFEGAVEVASAGLVVDIGDTSPVSGTTVAAFAVMRGPNETVPAYYTGWFGQDYGQINPRTTLIDGEFDFSPGQSSLFRLGAWRSGYQPYYSQDIAVIGGLLTDHIPLTPVITEEVDYVIAIDGDGFDPPVLFVPPGVVIQWVNVDIQDHTATSTDPALDYPSGVGNGGWDSGVLGAGDSYTFRMNVTGTLTYQDGENPFNTGIIIVDPAAGDESIYLPLVMNSSVMPHQALKSCEPISTELRVDRKLSLWLIR